MLDRRVFISIFPEYQNERLLRIKPSTDIIGITRRSMKQYGTAKFYLDVGGIVIFISAAIVEDFDPLPTLLIGTPGMHAICASARKRRITFNFTKKQIEIDHHIRIRMLREVGETSNVHAVFKAKNGGISIKMRQPGRCC
jgi:hypothetical protein